MVQVICSQCGTPADITPDESLCSGCGEDLQHLLPVDDVVGYFRDRVQEFWTGGDVTSALAETERGLTFVDSSDLHLLAALLAKQLARFDLMRRHVAAIPVDDSLRGEAEWLLRAHQDRQRALREAAQAEQAAQIGPDVQRDPFLDDLLGKPPAPSAPRRSPWAMVLSAALVAVAGVLVVGSWWWFGPGAVQPTPPARQAAEVLPTRVEATNTPMPPTPTVGAAPILPTATSTPVVDPNLVLATPEPSGVADANPRVALLVTVTPYDLAGFLVALGETELAALPITARIQDERLILQGFVHLDAQRRRLVQLLQGVPNVREVVAVELLLRPLPTYVVQPGDTLWSIVFSIYGDVERLDEFYAYNVDVLPSPDALAPDMVLKVMPLR